MKSVMPSLDNITWDRLWAESAVTYPCEAPDKPGMDIVFGEGFPTPDGRAKLVPASIVPPDEQPDDEYPMVLTTGRQLEHWHTGAITRRASVLDTLEPEAIASLSPFDLRKLGIEAGDPVRVATRRGAIELKARADGAVPSGVVFIPFCYAEAAAEHAHQSGAGPVREDSGVQVLCGKGGGGAGERAGMSGSNGQIAFKLKQRTGGNSGWMPA